MDALVARGYVYQAPWYANFFHQFPHYALSPFKEVPAIFNLEDRQYVESLSVIGLAVCLWLAVWLFVYVIYFCALCCPRCTHPEKQRNARAVRWSIILVALGISGAVALALYGNEECNKGVTEAQQSLSHFESDLMLASGNEASMASKVLQDISSSLRDHLQLLVEREQPQASRFTLSAISHTGTAVYLHKQLADSFKNLDFSRSVPDVSLYNQYRWIGSLLVSAWLLLLCLVMWAAAGCKSRWALLVAVVLLIISLIMVWGMVAAYLSITVATADLCVNSKSILRAGFNESSPEADLFNYYTACKDDSPISKNLIGVYAKLGDAAKELDALKDATRDSQQVQEQVSALRHNLSNAQLGLMELNKNLDCRPISRSYVDATTSLCHTGLLGSSYVVLGLTVAGTLMIVSVFLVHIAARRVGTKKAYLQVDVQDSVAIREQPRNEHPLYYRFSQVSTLEADGSTRTNGTSPAAAVANARASVAAAEGAGDARASSIHHTPPPAYNGENFFSSYGTGTSQGTLDSRQGNATEPLNATSNTFH